MSHKKWNFIQTQSLQTIDKQIAAKINSDNYIKYMKSG